MNDFVDSLMARFENEGLTFDDISLVTRYAGFLPHETEISSRLTTRINVNIPFVSAAMDTVTETRTAIVMALLGGIGIIHKNMSCKEQCKQIAAVKHHMHGLIRDPVVFKDSDTLQTVAEIREKKGYSFSGFPIVDEKGNLAGLLTATDIKFARDRAAPVSDVMTKEVITGNLDTNLQQAHEIMLQNKIGKLPLVKKGKLVGLYSFSDVSALVENSHPLYNRDSHHRLRAGAAVSPGDYKRVEALADEDTDVVVIDTAHGHTLGVIEMIRWVAKNYPDIDIIAGNVATSEGAVAMRDAGAHGIKVGIGPGSICTTRVVCGVGIPQVTAVHACSTALEGSIPIISDGGIRHSGDVPKAIAVGADTVMMGSVLAGTEESPGEKIIHQGRQYVIYRGMGSLAALREGSGSRERYQQQEIQESELVPQGIEGMVPYSGSVEKVLTQFCGGLRSSLGYCGCRSIRELQEKARLVRVSLAGLSEAHPHNVKIMKEAPNYRS